MMRLLVRTLASAVAAAVLASACLFAAFARDGAILLEMDRELPRHVTHGFYPPERAGDETFAWTSDRAGLRLTGADRRIPWVCDLRVRGARPDPVPLPDVTIDLDGMSVVTRRVTNEFADLRIDVPVRPGRDGLLLTLVVSDTFVPGAGDPRSLGVVVDRLGCAPAGGSARPPLRAVIHAAAGGAAFGAAAALAGVPLSAASALVLMVAAGQAALLSAGLAPYGRYSPNVLRAGVWIAASGAAFCLALPRLRRRPLSPLALTAILFSSAALHLQLLGLLHPSKMIIDAVFHAHRLQWVLDGRYFFTQGMPGGVSFPYAIALYVFAAPWTALTNDYVTLLRIVVSTAAVASGALLYVLFAKTWRDPLAGLFAVVLYHCVPLPYGILGNANMTNVFGQAVALAAVVMMALAPARSGAWLFWFGATAVCALAFLSHISTFTQLVATLLALGGLYWWLGGDEVRRPGRTIILATVVAAILSVVVYYGHFMDVYRTAWKARTQTAVTSPVAPAEPHVSPQESSGSRSSGRAPWHARLRNALAASAGEVGWPVLALAGLGAFLLIGQGVRDRVGLTVAALAATCAAFLLASTLSRVDAPFERYAAEFVGRVVLATFPGAVILAAIGAAWAWRAGLAARALVVIVLVAAAATGVTHWQRWFM